VSIEGLGGEMLESVRANVELRQYEERDVSPAEVHRLFERADDQIRTALEPFGYYAPQIDRKLEPPQDGRFHAVFRVTPGEPVLVREARVQVSPQAMELEPVRKAVQNFEPRVGHPLDHAAYERSKQQIETALASDGFLRARLVRHRVDVVRSANSAEIDLEWDAGERYRFGPVRFANAQFSDAMLQRYKPWREGDFYSADKLLTLQQSLVDADYFSAVAATPDLDHAQNGVVPIDVLLIAAKRMLYTGSVYVSTDTGPGIRLGVDRRWMNDRGHKLGGQIEYSSRLQEISTEYRVPKPGLPNRYLTYGAGYRDEQTDTSTSHMAKLAATETTERWRGFTRTLGLQYLNGDFEIGKEQGSTSLLYAEGLLTRKKADDLYFPMSGYSLLYGVRVAAESLLSDTSFVQLRAEAKWLKEIADDDRLILRGAVGGMTVRDFNALPPELRFFAGGDRSIRGFDYQEIGDRNAQGDVIGGEYLAAMSVEYEHYFRPKWGVAAFVDGGDAFTSQFNVNVGAGIGLRWKSPVGLLRLDVARPVVTEFDEKWRIHLVIGPDL
jgi:translocation and assembly module TamA